MSWQMIAVVLLCLAAGYTLAASGPGAPQPAGRTDAVPRSRLAVLWTSADPGVAHNVCFMYTGAAKSSKWFDEVQLIVWGPSARLLAGDKEVQAALAKLQAKGVDVKACVACANNYGVADDLRALGIDVKGMGRPLTEILKGDWKVLTF